MPYAIRFLIFFLSFFIAYSSFLRSDSERQFSIDKLSCTAFLVSVLSLSNKKICNFQKNIALI